MLAASLRQGEPPLGTVAASPPARPFQWKEPPNAWGSRNSFMVCHVATQPTLMPQVQHSLTKWSTTASHSGPFTPHNSKLILSGPVTTKSAPKPYRSAVRAGSYLLHVEKECIQEQDQRKPDKRQWSRYGSRCSYCTKLVPLSRGDAANRCSRLLNRTDAAAEAASLNWCRHAPSCTPTRDSGIARDDVRDNSPKLNNFKLGFHAFGCPFGDRPAVVWSVARGRQRRRSTDDSAGIELA